MNITPHINDPATLAPVIFSFLHILFRTPNNQKANRKALKLDADLIFTFFFALTLTPPVRHLNVTRASLARASVWGTTFTLLWNSSSHEKLHRSPMSIVASERYFSFILNDYGDHFIIIIQLTTVYPSHNYSNVTGHE
jgi:hypothetical protein